MDTFSLKDELNDSLLGSLDNDEETAVRVPKSIGLSKSEVDSLLREHGPNEYDDGINKKIMDYASMLWAPVSILMYVVIVMEIIESRWTDVSLLIFLLCATFIWALNDKMATNVAFALLKYNRPERIMAKRDGYFKQIEILALVPGDVIKFRTGDIIPADIILMEGSPVDTDQSELTGECLPVVAYPGDTILMGTIIKFGDGEGLVTATGKKTTLGRAAVKAPTMKMQQHLGRIQIGLYQVSAILAFACALCCVGIMVTMLHHHVEIPRAVSLGILMLVAIVPFATNLVYQTTVSASIRCLARKGIILMKPGVFENMAGLDMLLVDKSKVITDGKPEVSEKDSVAFIPNVTTESVLFYAYLSIRKRDSIYGSLDPIDAAIENAALRSQSVLTSSSQFEALDNQPFDPVLKYSEVTVREPTGLVIKAMKGQVKVVVARCFASEELEHRIANVVKALADQNLRSIGVARTDSRTGRYEFIGIIACSDPVHRDTRDCVRRAAEMGVEIRIITGDHIFVSKNTCKMVGIGANLVNTDILDEGRENVVRELVRRADGYADVFPDQKLTIVQLLQNQGLCCGITGNGVEEADAMKVATTGIALSNATPAVMASAVVVLPSLGLKDIMECIQEARKIFIRLRNFCIYRISTAFGLMFPLFFMSTCFNMANYFPSKQRKSDSSESLVGGDLGDYTEVAFVLPTIALVIFCILNNGTIIAIAKDSVFYSTVPLKWKMSRLFIMSSFIGVILLLQNIFMFMMGLAASPGDNVGASCGQAPDDFSDEEWCEIEHPSAVATDCTSIFGANYTKGTSKCDDGFAAIFGDSTNGVLRYAELKTLMLLSLSISVFLSAFTARTPEPFYTRRPSKHLIAVFSFSSVAISMFSLFCSEIGVDERLEDLELKTVCFVWGYAIMFFLLTDLVVKPYAHKLVYIATDDSDDIEHEERNRRRMQMIAISGVLDAPGGAGGENRNSLFSGSRRRASSDLLSGGASSDSNPPVMQSAGPNQAAANMRIRASLTGPPGIPRVNSMQRRQLGHNNNYHQEDRGQDDSSDLKSALAHTSRRVGMLEKRVSTIEHRVGLSPATADRMMITVDDGEVSNRSHDKDV